MLFTSHSRMSNVFSLVVFVTFIGSLIFVASSANISHARAAKAASDQESFCVQKAICADANDYGQYTVGHDEPSLLFYSNTPGAGNSYISRLTLPKDPPKLPKQDGSAGTFNFQLHPAFWFGMALCDTQSAPEFTDQCSPNSDANIFDSANPAAADYIGKHPGTAFMEMQFYPPGWAPFQLPGGISCDARQWCGALNIDSLIENTNTNQFNNTACRNIVNDETVNFAFVTKNGVSQAPANPVSLATNPAVTTPDPTRDLFMNSGDTLTVDLHDTSAGFQIVINDLTQGTSGSMTASIANGFGQVKFDPTGSGCTIIPNAFHPMYSTASEHTRVPWAAHSYNTAFSDEIGHWEYCNAVDSSGNCTQDGVHDTDTTLSGNEDDNFCLSAASSTRIAITGCAGLDADFDGVPYQHTWPGSLSNPGANNRLNPRSILFTSPLINGSQPYDRVAFETDLPRIESDTNPRCQRHVANPADPNPGQGCVNPAAGANFYPIFTTRNSDAGCTWQLGGANIPGTKNTFGGTSTAEYGELLQLAYPAPGGPTLRFNDFRQVLSNNPC
jgi:hypothetical protein